MKTIKKRTLFLVLILALGIGYFGYTHFKKTSVLLDVIHVDAESVVKVGIHDLGRSIVLDACSAPGYYWKHSSFFKSDSKKDIKENDNIGVDFKPYSLVFYTMKSVDNTFFTSFKIDNVLAFEKYVKNYIKEKSNLMILDDKGYKYLVLKKMKLVLAWNDEKLAAAISPEISMGKVKSIFDDVLLENKLISDEKHPVIETLSNNSSHIVYTKGKSAVTIEFIDGAAIIGGAIYNGEGNTYHNNMDYRALSKASLQVTFDANFTNTENKIAFIKKLQDFSFFTKNNIDITDLAERTSGFVNIGIEGTTTQVDTIISYEYDDNFEKVAVKQTQKKKVPQIFIELGTKNKNLTNYLEAQGAIQHNILKAIPYYTFHAKEDAFYTSFTTSKDSMHTKEIRSPNFFNFEVNFNRLKEDVSIPKIDKISVLLDRFKLQAKQDGKSNVIKIEGKLLGINAHVNIISQLFFGLQNKDSLSQNF